MQKQFKIIDLCCGVGGASAGIEYACQRQGLAYHITGIDIAKQPDYQKRFPLHTFIQCDVKEFLQQAKLSDYDFIWASPPCLQFTLANTHLKKKGKVYENMIPIIRQYLVESNLPFCIENVPQAPLQNAFILQGAMFGLPIIRRRKFEIGKFYCLVPPTVNQRGDVRNGKAVTVAGYGYNMRDAKHYKGKLKGKEDLTRIQNRQFAMQIDWTKNAKSLNNAVPPAYSDFIFSQFLFQFSQKNSSTAPQLQNY